MSRFDAAANKAARTAGVTAAPKPKAKVASKAAAVKVAPKSKASAPPPKLTTLEDKKKFVKMWEMKIDDKDCEVQAEANKKAKKDLETALKKLQTDETYLKVKEEIKEMELQGKREAERAALEKNSQKADAKAAAPKVEMRKATEETEEASEELLRELEAQLHSTGKDPKGEFEEKADWLQEAFRCVVEAFESLVDANRRQSLSAVSPEKPKQKPERPGRTGRPAPPTARPTPTGHVPRAPTARHAPRARPKGPSSGDAAKSRGVPKAAATSKAESSNHVDYDEMLYRFMYGERKKPKIMAALRELSEEVLQGFARYLESDTLRKPTRLALEACPAKRRRRRKAPITQEEAQMPKLSRGIVRQHRRLVNGYYIDYSASV
ncbi:Translational activator GCN1, partial [Durusdinium trenchii]